MADVFSEFQANYKYKVAGVYNVGLYNVSRALDNDDKATLLKSRLTSNTIRVAQIKQSGQDADTISKQVGQTQISYLRTASQALYDARDDSKNLSNFRSALNSSSSDLEKTINQYLSSGNRTADEDKNFVDNAQYILRKLNSMYVTIKGRSAAAGTRVDINLYQMKRRMESLSNLLNNFPAAAPAAAAAAAPAADATTSTDPAVDDGTINGTTASGGQTVDVTA